MMTQPNEAPATAESEANEAILPPMRILVALDNSPHSRIALHAAAELAARMQAELDGLFVEDINLIRLSGLAFCYEVGAYSRTPRRLDSRTIERDFRVQAQQMRHALAQAAVIAQVNWSFHVVRGSVTNELLAASDKAAVLTLGRIGRTPGKRLGSTAQIVMRSARRPVFLLGDEALRFPLTVLHTGSPASDRALALATTLLQGDDGTLHLVTLRDPNQAAADNEARDARLMQELEAQEIDVTRHIVDHSIEHAAQLTALLDVEQIGTLLLPLELVDLLERYARSAILVP